MAGLTFKIVQKGAAKENGLRLLMIRATLHRKFKHIGTGISIPKKDFNPKATLEKFNWVRGTHDFHEVYNQSLKAKLKNILQKIADLETKGQEINLEVVHRIMKGDDAENFMQFYREFIEKYNTPKTGGAFDKYTGTLNKILQFNKGQNLMFSEVNLGFIERFENWLMTEYRPIGKDGKPRKGSGPNKRNTASKTLSFLKTVIRAAVKAGRIPYIANPFLNFELKKQKVHKAVLRKAELELFINYPIPEHLRAFHSRKIFLFQFYVVGSRIGDMLALRWSNLVLDIENNQIMAGRVLFIMEKTEKPRSYKLSTQAIEILNYYYPSREKNGFVFPFLKNEVDYSDPRYLQKQIESKTTCINKDLTLWTKKAGIDKHVTTHTARHSFSNEARRKGVAIYDISKLLGHSSIKTTQIYMEDFDEEEIDKAQDKIYD